MFSFYRPPFAHLSRERSCHWVTRISENKSQCYLQSWSLSLALKALSFLVTSQKLWTVMWTLLSSRLAITRLLPAGLSLVTCSVMWTTSSSPVTLDKIRKRGGGGGCVGLLILLQLKSSKKDYHKNCLQEGPR